MLKLEKTIGYQFNNQSILECALTHPSFNEHNPSRENNQRLEFLGDSVISLILTEALYTQFPNEDEGALSKKRAVFIRGSFQAKIARNLDLHKHILMSKSELNRKGNLRNSTLEDSIEALVGAIYLDGGIFIAQERVLNWFGNLSKILDKEEMEYNPKGQLQELIQEQDIKDKIKYQLTKESGPAHKKSFEIDLIIGKKTLGSGKAKTKKEAEEIAALKALKKLRSKKLSSLK